MIWFSSGRQYITSPWPRGLYARLGSERFKSQLRHLIFFANCLSQINIELNISVAISLIANLLQLKHWKALVALYKNKLVYNLTTFTFLTILDPNKFSTFCALISNCNKIPTIIKRFLGNTYCIFEIGNIMHPGLSIFIY
jgi:hypothetical protein